MTDEEREQLRTNLQDAMTEVFRGMRLDQERIAELEQSIKTIIKEDGVVVSRQAKQLAKVPALVETLRVIAADGDDWAGKVANDALAEWEKP